MIQISFPDGSKKEYKAGINAFEIAQSISPSLAKSALYAKVNDEFWDLSRAIPTDAELQILTLKDAETLSLLRHSLAHVLAEAVKELWINAKPVIGPAVADGFYYDFDLEHHISSEDFSKIEAKMKEIIKRGDKIERQILSRDEAIQFFKKLGEPYKVDNIKRVPEGEDITCYKQGNFIDLCRGPHVNSTSKLPKSFKIARVAGAYLHGDSKQKMLQRVYVYAFENKEKLSSHLVYLEEQAKRDHRKLNHDLDLYVLNPDVGLGLPSMTEYGTILREELNQLAKEMERKYKLKRVTTPHISKENMFLKSGHLPFYKDDMYSPMDIDGEDYYLKPMNCPHHHTIYMRKPYSYRDLPIRYTEYGTVYRYESSGSLNGLFRVRSISQNDIHIYCRYDQAYEEFKNIMLLHEEYYNIFGISKDDFYIEFALPDMKKLDKFVDAPEKWTKAKDIMQKVINDVGFKFVEEEGEAAFYGPKFDFKVKSAIGTEYGISTNQLDFYASGRFDLTYKDKDGVEQPIYIVHAAPLGAHERTIGFLTEHYAGKFPAWLAPIQVMVVPVSEKHISYAKEIYDKLFSADVKTATHGLRVELDSSNERMGKKLRNASLKKIPYVLIVGDNEIETKTVSLRNRNGEQENNLSLNDFISKIKNNIENRIKNPEEI
ncbi:MAG: threonine--tRNA ligase [Alphaproteobacteria bacterium]|nr:MAG: threonine--tRNA ligase [Rickettsiaceae bacterium 4572_127]